MEQGLEAEGAKSTTMTLVRNGPLASRAYQIEMFEASLQGNTIVVMDTGSGKTHVAILRIMYELEHGDDGKLIWFLAPTVTLCEQQHRTIQASFPAVCTRLIVGSDNVDCWKTKDIWDAVLKDQRILVTTHAILSDALFHGFVTMQRLALLIFDEAHHCVREHPANKIMKDHYYPCLTRDGRNDVPAVLGLTASPVMSAKVRVQALQKIESNLDSTTKTPRLHREELRNFVHLPKLVQLHFATEPSLCVSTALQVLCTTLERTDIWQDPVVIQLMAQSTANADLEKILQLGRIRNQDALRRFCSKAEHVATQLGSWAADLFISLAAARLEQAVTTRRNIMFGWDDKDQDYLHCILRVVCNHPAVSNKVTANVLDVSAKVRELVRFLGTLEKQKFSGIIFVEQRAIAALLCKLLSVHTHTRHLSCAGFVGTSNNFRRRTDIGDLADAALQDQVLDDFRMGTCNLIIATSVLEEGIDISSCNLVICFDRPVNLKSFVQRRGRARDQKSNFVMMVSDDDISTKKTNWQALEEEMIKVYLEERKALETVLELEDTTEISNRRYEIQSTHAVLSHEIALQHLSHFCDVLPKADHVENGPIFIFHWHPIDKTQRGEVILPISVHPSVRRTLGRQYWHSERQAKKDAAFEAYVALHRADLVNDHLLPALTITQGPSFEIESRSAMVSVSSCLDPWVEIATNWCRATENQFHAVEITIERPQEASLQMLLILPQTLPAIPKCKLYWNADTVYHASFLSKSRGEICFNRNLLKHYRNANDLLTASLRHHSSASKEGERVLVFAPLVPDLAEWLAANSGTLPAAELKASAQLAAAAAIVRSPSLYNRPLLFDSWADEDTLKATTFPRRRNFLTQTSSETPNKSSSQHLALAKSHMLPVSDTTFDRLGLEAVTFSLLVPSLQHYIGNTLLSSKLCSELLAEVGFSDIGIVLEALSATSANSPVNYQRLELIGDSTLKFMVAIQLFATKRKWHEGYLSAAKDCIVANSRLARAALDRGLDAYIITQPFSPRKWRPLLVHELAQHNGTSDRKISTKILADVVEALIGAAFIDGGISAAVKCAHVFLPEVDRQSATELLQPLLRSLEPSKGGLPPHLAQAQTLLNYNFRNPSILIESLTHPSLTSDSSTQSYQRLEFLGDAVLDMLIVRKLVSYNSPRLSHVQMHLIKSALVNAAFLAFICMEMATEKEITDVMTTCHTSFRGPAEVVSITKSKRVALYQFLRSSSTVVSLVREQEACLRRYESLASRLRSAIDSSTQYPWALLSQLNAPKFLSDIVEALIGAVFIDSHGDIGPCEELAGRLGIIRYLERIIKDNVEVLHPKNRLGELVGQREGNEEKGSNKVKYTIRREEEGNFGYRCNVSIGDVVFEEVREGLSRDEVTTRAAEVAVQVLLMTQEPLST